MGIFMAATLGAIGIWLVVLFFFLLKQVKRTKKNLTIFLSGAFLSLFVILISFGQLSNLTAVKRVTSGSIVDGAAQHRLMSYSLGAESILKRPLLGNGFGTYSYFNKEVYGDIIDKDWETGISHTIFSNVSNQYLQIVADMGLLGFFFFILFVQEVWVSAKSAENYTVKYIGVWSVIFILFNQTANWLVAGSYIWVMISVSIGLLMSEQARPEEYTNVE
jgi:O-antigen ligase